MSAPAHRLPGRLLRLAGIALLATVSACAASHEEAVQRFEAERTRWKADRLERRLTLAGADSSVASRRLQHEHTEIARRFGPDGRLGANSILDPDARVRYRIAGSSALYAVDLEARESVGEEACAEYSGIAERYAFDSEIALRARIREGLARERRGEESAALAAYERALETPPSGDPFAGNDVPVHEQLRADLEVHVALLARDLRSVADASDVVRRSVDRLRARAEKWAGHAGENRLRRRLAEALAIADRGEEAAALLQELLGAASTGEARAEFALLIGEVEEVTRHRPDEAETWYRRAVAEGIGRPIGNDARLHLGHLLRAAGREREAADFFSIAIISGASTTAAHRAEALYGQARCMDDLDRREDALNAAARGATEAGPFGLACAARRARQARDFDTPGAEQEMNDFVARAGREPGPRGGAPSLKDLSQAVRREREAEAWADVVAELRVVAAARNGTALGEAARETAARFTPPGAPAG